MLRQTLVSFVLVALMHAPHAFAGGEIWGRTSATASIRSCDGQLLEQLHEAGNIHGFSAYLLLACMQSKTEAAWVLLSGTSCYDRADNPAKCNTRNVRAVPRFIVDENFWQAKDTPSPAYPMLYNLLRYGIGDRCKLNEQKYEAHGIYDHREVDKFWECDNIIIQDNVQDIPRQKWKMFRLTTTSSKPMTVIPLEDKPLIYDPRTHFVLPESSYILNIDELL